MKNYKAEFMAKYEIDFANGKEDTCEHVLLSEIEDIYLSYIPNKKKDVHIYEIAGVIDADTSNHNWKYLYKKLKNSTIDTIISKKIEQIQCIKIGNNYYANTNIEIVTLLKMEYLYGKIEDKIIGIEYKVLTTDIDYLSGMNLCLIQSEHILNPIFEGYEGQNAIFRFENTDIYIRNKKDVSAFNLKYATVYQYMQQNLNINHAIFASNVQKLLHAYEQIQTGKKKKEILSELKLIEPEYALVDINNNITAFRKMLDYIKSMLNRGNKLKQKLYKIQEIDKYGNKEEID